MRFRADGSRYGEPKKKKKIRKKKRKKIEKRRDKNVV